MTFSFYVSFYLPHYTEKVGYGWAYGIFAILSVVLFLLVVLLMFKGGEIRSRLGDVSQSELEVVHQTAAVQVDEEGSVTEKNE